MDRLLQAPRRLQTAFPIRYIVRCPPHGGKQQLKKIEMASSLKSTKHNLPLSLTTCAANAAGRLSSLPAVEGAEFAAAAAGVRYHGRPDVMLAHLCPGTKMAGFFTQSSTRAAPVRDCEEKLCKLHATESEAGIAIFANAGNANAFTGREGIRAVAQLTSCVSAELQLSVNHVLTASTGVIGEPLTPDINKILAVINELTITLSPNGLGDAARAIITTDTFPKAAATQIETKFGTINVAGIAKGSGMIAPRMATMLAFIFTDAKIGQSALQSLAQTANQLSFNAITVDGDTSTNDTLLVAATGKANHPEILLGNSETEEFARGLNAVMTALAEQIVRDGEGAKKLVKVCVENALTEEDAKLAARAIANSPLVKTAIAGEDPNWGRIVMAIGKSGAQIDVERLAISLGQHFVAEKGQVAPSYNEAAAAAYMKGSEILISVHLGVGEATAQVMTCDLTHDYISINADYRS